MKKNKKTECEIIKPFKSKARGEFTKLNNAEIDYLMPNLSPNAWKVLCLIIRKTRGWQKSLDAISYSQIKQGAGIGSYSTISKVLCELEMQNCINIERGKLKHEVNNIMLNEDYEIFAEKSVVRH